MNQLIRAFEVTPEQTDYISQIQIIERQAFKKDGLTFFNLLLFSQVGNLYALAKEDEIIASAVLTAKNTTALVVSFVVKEAYRGLHNGNKLMKFIIDDLKINKIKKVQLTVAPGNKPAVNFYLNKFKFNIIKKDYIVLNNNEKRWLLEKEIF